ncbi:BLUF domain-containing protein [Leucothrix mucor]|uniref:BLUF domain-containing protein n=1 Tax=Leucothrix mucor TaxID=45248 RepID=UPI0003B4A809|nr:BLUF domain-containing protein [Leucothrix mucor]
MIHLIYISTATSWPSEEDLKALLEHARTNNTRRNITGMLLYDNAVYIQVLEGDKEAVEEVYNIIVKDPRNNGHVKLIEEEITERDFPDWSMGFKNLESCSPDELEGFHDAFGGRLDKDFAVQNTSAAVKLLKRFSRGGQ